jgi:betaine-aldehyde dehydrogenase
VTTTPAIADRRMLIGGELVESSSGEWIESTSPATEEFIGRVPAGTAADVADAVDAAKAAFPAWADLAPAERTEYLRELASRLRERKDEILHIEVVDTGNTIRKMSADVDRGADSLDYYAGLVLEAKGETIPATSGNLHFSLREPYGVVGRIIPFNHPVQFAASKLAAPLAAGNAVVLKPSEQSPLSALVLAELCQEVLPPGVVNIVTGLGAVAGDALVRHPDVKRLAFTGSVPTGLAIQRAAAESAVKELTLELGGKNPMIVFPDADLNRAVVAAVNGMNFAWSGQSCGSTSRLFLHDSIYDNCLERVCELVANLRMGDPLDPDSDMGPVNSKGQFARDLHYVEVAHEDGAKLVTGGERPAGEPFTRGYWLQPTVFADVTPAMRIFQEEVFGPVLSVIRWHDIDDVIRMANSVEYGLTAAVWTRDLTNALQTARRVQAGYVWINGGSAHFLGTSFGGKKNSGIGREEGTDELLSYTELKTIHVML